MMEHACEVEEGCATVGGALLTVHPRHCRNNPLNPFSSDSIEITRGSHCIKLQILETEKKNEIP